MPLSPNIFTDASARFERFRAQLNALDELGDQVTAIVATGKLRVRGESDQFLSLLMMWALGKALKTFQAIQRLCVLGFGEDAAILLRANINLLINSNYITGNDDPNERARDFWAYAFLESRKYLEAAAAGSRRPPPADAEPPYPQSELAIRGERWRRTRISARAKRTMPVHYDVGYRFYSSIEHSDVLALSGYFGDEDEDSMMILSEPSDSHVALVLGHSFAVMADILECVCRYFNVDEPQIFDRVRRASEALFPQPGA